MSNVVIGRMPFTLGIALARRRLGVRAALARRGGGAVARQRVGEPGRRRVPLRRRGRDAGRRAAARPDATGRTGAPRSRSAGPPSRAAWRWRSCSPRAARTTSSAPRSGRCCSSASARSRSSTRAAAPRSGRPRSTWRSSSPRSRSRTRSGQNALRPGVVLGPALLVLFARPRAPRVGDRRGRRRAAVPAVAAGRARRGGGARRPVDGGGVPPGGARLPGDARAARRAPGGAAHAQPLGGDVPRAGLPARARLAPAARPQGQPAVLRPRRPAHRATRYERWLRKNAVRWVALPNAPLDFSAEVERGAAARRPAVPQAGAQLAALADLGGARPRAARSPAPRG